MNTYSVYCATKERKYGMIINSLNVEEPIYSEFKRVPYYYYKETIFPQNTQVKLLIFCLKRLLNFKIDYVTVYTSEQTIVGQIYNNGKIPILTKPHMDMLQELLAQFDKIDLVWIPKEENKARNFSALKANRRKFISDKFVGKIVFHGKVFTDVGNNELVYIR